MDPITLIVAALVAGGQGVAKDVIKDSYAALKALLRKRFGRAGVPGGKGDELGGDGAAEAAPPVDVLEAHEADPEAWDQRLRDLLKLTGAEQDQQIVAAAQALLDQAGKYRVDARGAQGVQIGDHGTMTNTFGVTRTEPTQSSS